VRAAAGSGAGGRPRTGSPGWATSGRLRSPRLLALAAFVAGCRAAPPDVVLILVDTLRADHLGAYGYSKPVSPAIDGFASRATLFENAMAQAPHTIPSVLQIMTSRYLQGDEILPGDRTLAEILREHGYQTAAVVENANFETARSAHGLLRGFDRFRRNGALHRDSVEQQHWKTATPADCITAEGIRVLRARDPARPLFLWLHYLDPHDPYLPPFDDDMEALSWGEGSRFTGDVRRTFLYRGSAGEQVDEFTAADRQHLVDLYDAEVRYVDQSIGELLAFLESEGIFGPALVILASDHGEGLGERGVWTHGLTLYEPEVHIPLIVKWPGQRRGFRRSAPVQAIDILPTVLDAAGIPAPAGILEGTSLRDERRRLAFAFWNDWRVVRGASWKLVQRGEEVELFRVGEDPAEQVDRAGESAAAVGQLRAAGEAKLAALGLSPDRVKEVSQQTIERLRALGYLP
jgi:arylsulfatase